jgi:hypothetical protein
MMDGYPGSAPTSGEAVKITSSSDWREPLPFETPVIVADVVPGDPTRCSVCGGASPLRERTELWAVKHRHPNQHAGYVRFYCLEHRPAVAAPRVAETVRRGSRNPRPATAARPAAPRRTAVEEPRAMCPDCFVEVPATGVCGMCGTRVA